MRSVIKKKLAVTSSLLLITIGLIGVVPGIYYFTSNHGSVAAHGLPHPKSSVKAGTPLVAGHPSSISIPSIGINIPVIDGFYNTKTRDWTLSLDKAQFAATTAQPNNKQGNTFIYGHYRVGVFYTLPHIQTGDEATVTTDNGYVFTYKFYQTYPTQPTDTSVLHYQGPPMLTLQTCSGSFYQNRQMYLFSLVKYEKVNNQTISEAAH
jgi:LPXTG-site transpeptidase (sortase) family protein